MKRVWISIFWYTFLSTIVLLFLSCFIFCEINFSLKSSLSKRKIPRSYFPLLLCIILTLLPLLLSHFEVFPPSSPPPPANTLWQNVYNCSVKKGIDTFPGKKYFKKIHKKFIISLKHNFHFDQTYAQTNKLNFILYRKRRYFSPIFCQ